VELRQCRHVDSLGWLSFTTAAADVLESAGLEAIAAHELAHLNESRRVRLVRGFSVFVWMSAVIGLLRAQVDIAYLVVGR
jgi:hypothetical protein